jgi:hypothetical protein
MLQSIIIELSNWGKTIYYLHAWNGLLCEEFHILAVEKYGETLSKSFD